jgi:hypothetical protein
MGLKMRYRDFLGNEKGMAMVLSISLVGLLTLLGIWMSTRAITAFRTTKSMTRSEQVVNLADGSLQKGLRCIRTRPLMPSYSQIINEDPLTSINTGLPSYVKMNQTLSYGEVDTEILYLGYNTLPPPGWMISWQGYGRYHNAFFEPRGTGRIPLPDSKGGKAKSMVSALVNKVMR